ncbi:MAG TPA: hypothetical protein VFC92_12465 [Bacteroidales bacterium]|nr:hypothetical protein [Bacteroidales bacterium]
MVFYLQNNFYDSKCTPSFFPGGPWGYVDLKEIMADKNHPEYEENAEWFGLEEDETWDPKEFDLEDAQSFLKELYGTEE